MSLRQSSRRFSAARLGRIARGLLRASTLCAIATVSPGGRAHVNTAYFAWGPAFEIVWISAPTSRHSRNLRANASAAVAVYDSRQRWGGKDRGVQLVGRARELSGRLPGGRAREARGSRGRDRSIALAPGLRDRL